MKNTRKAVLLLTLCLVLMMSIVTMVGAEVTYDALDLSGTAVTVLDLTDASVDNNTTKLVVKGVTQGVVGEEITEGLSFTSSDQAVATVSADGIVTAVDEGAAVITVTYGELTGGIVITVGVAKKTYDYETGSVNVSTLYGWDDGYGNSVGYPGEWSKAQEIVSTTARTGSKSLWIKNLARAKSEGKDAEGNKITFYDETKSQFPSYSVHSVKAEQPDDMTINSVAQVWFYDDGTAEKEVSIVFFADKSATEARYNLGIYFKNNTYSISGDANADATINSGISRRIGWHQIVSVGTPTGFTIYIDGVQFAKLSRTDFKQYRVAVGRKIPAGTSNPNHELWLDDYAHVDTTKREPVVTSFDLSKTENTVLCLTDEDATNDTTQIKVRGFRADGKEIENAVVEGLTYTSGNTDVATVSADGLVTAVNEGVAVITATNGTISKDIVIVVGETTASKTFEASSDWKDVSGKAVVSNEKTRASEKSLKLYANGGNGTTENIFILGVDGGPTAQGVLTAETNTISYWYYDNGMDNSGRFGTTGWRSPRNSFTLCLSHYWLKPDGSVNQCPSGSYGFHGDLTPNTSGMSGVSKKARKTGWHQVVITSQYVPVTVDNVAHLALSTTMYIDGDIVLDGTTTSTMQDSPELARQLFLNMYYQTGYTTDEIIVYFDDANAIDVSDKKANVTVTYDNTNGAVKVGEEEVVSGEAIAVDYGKDLTLTFEPKEGYEAKVEGYTVTNNQLTLENIKADATLTVTFEKLITTPSITGNGESGYLFKEANYNNTEKPAYVSFYKIVVPAGFEVKAKGYGMYLNGMQLIAEGKNEDNMFGIRVFGPAINDTDSYEFKGFATLVKDGEETIVETEIAGSNDAVNQQ